MISRILDYQTRTYYEENSARRETHYMQNILYVHKYIIFAYNNIFFLYDLDIEYVEDGLSQLTLRIAPYELFYV